MWVAAGAAEAAAGSDGESGDLAAAKGRDGQTRGEGACWLMQAATSASCWRWVGAKPPLLAAWRRGEVRLGDVSDAVAQANALRWLPSRAEPGFS